MNTILLLVWPTEIHNLCELKGKRHSEKPFGGIQLIFAGDFCQLPAIKDSKSPSIFHKCQRKPHNANAPNKVCLWIGWCVGTCVCEHVDVFVDIRMYMHIHVHLMYTYSDM